MIVIVTVTIQKNIFHRVISRNKLNMQNRHVCTDLKERNRTIIAQSDLIQYKTYLIFIFLEKNPIISIIVRVILITLVSEITYSHCALNGTMIPTSSNGLSLLQFKAFSMDCENLNTSHAIRSLHDGTTVIGYVRKVNLSNEAQSFAIIAEHMGVNLMERFTKGTPLEMLRSSVESTKMGQFYARFKAKITR